jgi:hypothetical protein
MAGAIGQFRAGKNSRISANGVILKYTEFDITDRADFLDTTNYENQGE